MLSYLKKSPYQSRLPRSLQARKESSYVTFSDANSWSTAMKTIFALLVFLLASFIGLTLGRSSGYSEADALHLHFQEKSCLMHSPDPSLDAATTETVCSSPYFRREWRSLSTKEKASYIDAVNCLAETPSILRENGTLYDDFPWVHNLIAHSSKSPGQIQTD
jgi:hypothetical protein